ncbi:unnamed protein product [Albugo candida]|uniref:DUF962 domain-containing protein n=1 Tax=Albugo candida TaxID=65357 RepID=A0A024FW34_9STRA|nr:unnamed protein product [Albugo candida]|eukprot:CCI10869.1 unnamed protein product [Albugo candida]
MNAFKRRFQLENQLVFYMSYHRNTTNRNIHLLCIWPILITAQVILASISPGWINSMNYSDSSQLEQCLRLNYAALMAAIYIPWYIMLDPIGIGTSIYVIFKLCELNFTDIHWLGCVEDCTTASSHRMGCAGTRNLRLFPALIKTCLRSLSVMQFMKRKSQHYYTVWTKH